MEKSTTEAKVLAALKRADERFNEGDPKRTLTTGALASALGVRRTEVEDALRGLIAEHRVRQSEAAPGRWMIAPAPWREARKGAAQELMRTSRAYRDDPHRHIARFRAAIIDGIDTGFTTAQIETITGVNAAELDALADEA